MKKIFPLLVSLLIFAGCTFETPMNPPRFAKDIEAGAGRFYELLVTPGSGLLYALATIEINSNFSSLLYDKTKEQTEKFYARSLETIDEGKTYFVIPARMSSPSGTEFNEPMGRMVKNYFAVTGIGRVTNYIQNADYIVTTEVRESAERSYAENSSMVVLSIMDRSDTPVFISMIKLKSESDENFWYFPRKDAKPVRYLTMKGLGNIFAEALPKAYGKPVTFWERTEERIEKYYLAKKERGDKKDMDKILKKETKRRIKEEKRRAKLLEAERKAQAEAEAEEK
ncbi:hypothetical protein [Limisalsivibrio acetivorans]|uniref:hypothetical protein n=1 Tax=Limisalsivibrio acetivorans TaxID=1304888 RepID=UPI0003B4AEB8|nr:hypothetical protein [Limisalsivibrio acetivorans]